MNVALYGAAAAPASLLSKAEFRPMRSVVGVSPAGAGNFDGMPDRATYAEGWPVKARPVIDVRSFSPPQRIVRAALPQDRPERYVAARAHRLPGPARR